MVEVKSIVLVDVVYLAIGDLLEFTLDEHVVLKDSFQRVSSLKSKIASPFVASFLEISFIIKVVDVLPVRMSLL